MMQKNISPGILFIVVGVCVWSVEIVPACADNWPMLGRDGTRNGVSPEKGVPTDWAVELRDGNGRVYQETQGIRWSNSLGAGTLASPVVSNGLVWIGMSEDRKNQNNIRERVGALRCLRVADGQLAYEYHSAKFDDRSLDLTLNGRQCRVCDTISSSPLIEDDRLWITTNTAEVVCLDIGPLIRRDGGPRVIWKLDLVKTFQPHLHVPLMWPPSSCSIGASWNGRIYVTINNGVGGDSKTVPKPEVPSLVCLDKNTGDVDWSDNSPGANILVTQFASPTV